MIRAFVAIDMPQDLSARLTMLQFMLPLPRRVEPEQFHLTLAFLDRQPDVVLEAAHEAFERLRMEPFALTLAGVGLFGGAKPRAAWAGVEPSPLLERLQAKVTRAARMAGADLPAQRFVPHVTLGRFAPPEPEIVMRLERAVVEQSGFRAGPFIVQDFVLYASYPGPKGARYDELMRYPLA